MNDRARDSIAERFPGLKFEAAVNRANERFDHSHPEWAALLIDDRFLRAGTEPILARFLDGPTSPEPDELVNAWVSHLSGPVEQLNSIKDEVLPLATRYLLTLAEELKKTDLVEG